jgi:protein-tyrosine-phosphatase
MRSHAGEDRAFRVLFVCTGNTCRSPMAEVIARRRAEELGWDRLLVGSAGVSAFDGSGASGGAVRAAAANGLDLSSHSATRVTHEEVSAADLILTMSSAHLARVMELGAGERAAMLTSFAGAAPEDTPSSIPDPIGGSDEEYRATFELLERLIGRVLERLGPVVAP